MLINKTSLVVASVLTQCLFYFFTLTAKTMELTKFILKLRVDYSVCEIQLEFRAWMAVNVRTVSP